MLKIIKYFTEPSRESSPKACLAWDIDQFENMIKLRRKLMNDNELHSMHQEIIIYQDSGAKLLNVNLHTPNEVIAEEIENKNIKAMKKKN